MIIEIKNLSVSFGDGEKTTTVLNNINFTLDRQKIVYVIGESGSGKTMLAQAIAGLLPQNAVLGGGIYLDNNKLPSKLIETSPYRGNTIGYIFQDYLGSFSPVRTIGWHYRDSLLKSGLSPDKQKEALARVADIFKKLGFNDYDKTEKSYPHQLSGGQLQRLQIGLVILQRPGIILADEITTALDAHIQNEIIRLAMSVSGDIGAKLVFITHDFRLVATGNDNPDSEIVVMFGGRIMEILSDTHSYHHPYTRLLISAVPRFDDGDAVTEADIYMAENEITGNPACPFATRCPRKLPVCEAVFPALSVSGSRFYCHNPVL